MAYDLVFSNSLLEHVGGHDRDAVPERDERPRKVVHDARRPAVPPGGRVIGRDEQDAQLHTLSLR